MHSIEQKLLKAIDKRKANNSFRQLVVSKDLVDFSSNDYLGLAHNVRLLNDMERSFRESSEEHKLGATGSRLISGNSPAYERLEAFLAETHRSESALVFNSGYSACLGALSTIPQKGDTILYDELSHACIKDGARLSMAEKYSFRHSDLEDLERKLNKAKGNSFIAVESVYSMDGDAAPLTELALLAKKFNAALIVDEAHTTGIKGENGSGMACELGIEKDIFLRVHTFGKAMGVHGACIASSKLVRDYLINFCRPFIYTTALSLHSIISIAQSYAYLAYHPELSENLHKKIDLFKQTVRKELLPIISNSPIQAVLIPGNSAVKKAAKSLQTNGFDIRPILSPTVALGKERLRISLHVHNSEEEILGMAQVLNELID